MLRHERRLLIDCLGIGVALTLLVVAADGSGLLRRLEDYLYDLRARTCQRFTPPPSSLLVHLDIDDPSVDAIGWPVPRAQLARIFDEIRLAGPKAVETDVLFSSPSPVQYVPRPSPPATQVSTLPATQPAETFDRIDHDAEFAAAVRRMGNVIMPANFQTEANREPWFDEMVRELRGDPELPENVLPKRIAARWPKVSHVVLEEHFYAARREAFDGRLRELNLPVDTPFDEVLARLLPRTPIEIRTVASNVLREQWAKYCAAREFRRFAWPRPQGMDATFSQTRIAIAPLRELSAASSGGAFVDYTQFGGSPVIRTLPLLLESDGRVYPQMGLALACRMLEADVSKLRIEDQTLVIPHGGAGGETRVPLAPPRATSSGATYGYLMDIPWFGARQWETMYDFPAHKARAQHVPMMEVWQAVVARDKLERNNAAMDDAIRGVFEAYQDQASLDRYNEKLPPPDDYAAREAMARKLIEDYGPFEQDGRAMDAKKIDYTTQVFLKSMEAVRRTLDQTPDLVKQLRDSRAALEQDLGGKAVLVGWTSTAAIADFVPTSLHEKCPGVVVHGVVFNGIMTGETWRRAPDWVTWLTTLLVGAGISFTTARFAPLKALLIALGAACAFAVVNGTVLFDYGNVILGAAAPLVAIGLAWSACTMTRVIIESAERSRITRRFSNYVDPKIVSYVMENPNVTFDGERREMTVVFTDLAGFTAISERLGEKVVPMLNELFGELVPVIRRNDGTLNKFLGDGIMFFFNAPRSMPSHAAVAVKAVLEMQEKVSEFNVRLREQGLPQLAMRAGIMTAEMIVGDAGGAGAADYTVLGDAVNTGARLEPANKFVGTQTLISARTASLLDGQFLVRPIGKLKVVGKDESVMVYEPMDFADRATDEQRELARFTAELVEAFTARKFDETLRLADEHDSRFGKSKLTAVYRGLARHYLDNPPGEDFDGRIVLTEK